MANMFKMMQQAMSAQRELKRIQKELARQTVEYSSGGGAVKAVARADMTLASIHLDPAACSPDKISKLESLIVSAVNGAMEEAKKKAGAEMSKLTSGMGLDGLLGG